VIAPFTVPFTTPFIMASSRSTISWLFIVALVGLTRNGAYAKLGKVKAGSTYKLKDEVHIIVNSVG
jgi:hypothetical protein